MNNTLESSRIFPYVAWTLVIGFALFTLLLTMRVQNEISDISDNLSELETRVSVIEAKALKK